MTGRPVREVCVDGGRVRLVEAWRAPSGLGLAYFLADPGPESLADRRAGLPAGTGVSDLSEDAVRELWEGAAPLTATEVRFEDSRGDSWLAQATGPAWSESGAADAVGVRLVCLTADRETLELSRIPLPDLEPADLRALVDGPEE